MLEKVWKGDLTVQTLIKLLLGAVRSGSTMFAQIYVGNNEGKYGNKVSAICRMNMLVDTVYILLGYMEIDRGKKERIKRFSTFDTLPKLGTR